MKIWLSPYGTLNDSTAISSSACANAERICENYSSTMAVYDTSQGSSPIASVSVTNSTWTAAAQPCGTGNNTFFTTPPCDSGVSVVIPNSATSPIPDTLLVNADYKYVYWNGGMFESTLSLQGALHVEAVGNNYAGCGGTGIIN